MKTDQELEKTPSSIPWRLVTPLAMAMLLSSIGVSAPNVALPSLAKEYSASFSDAQWIILTYLLTITVLIVGVGHVGDMMGRRRVLMAGILIATTGAFLCSVSGSLYFLMAARAIQGLGAATLMAMTVAFVSETVPQESTGRVMGLMGSMSAIGTASGPSFGGILISVWNWRAIFVMMVLLGVLNFLLAYRYLPDRPEKIKSDLYNFDIQGAVLLGVTLVSYSLCMTVGKGHLTQSNFLLLAVTLFGGFFFFLTEKRVPRPLIRLDLLKTSKLLANFFMNALVSTVMMSTLIIGPFYLSRVLGLNEAWVGGIMSVGPTLSFLTGLPAGRIVDRIGPSAGVVIGLSEMVIGTFALALLPSKLGTLGYILSVGILSPGYQMFQAANNTETMRKASLNERGVVSALLSLSRNLGLITGASVMGTVFAFASKTNTIALADSDSIAVGMQVTFSVAAMLVSVTLVIAIGMISKEERNYLRKQILRLFARSSRILPYITPRE